MADAAREARDLARGARAVRRRGAARRHRGLGGRAQRASSTRGGGEVELAPAERGGRRGLRVAVRDAGPGIADVAAALRDGVSTGGSLGLGLPGARRLMDDFAIRQRAGRHRGRDGALGGRPARRRSVPGVCARARRARRRRRSRSRSATACCSGSPPGRAPSDVVRGWRTRPWHAPAQLAEAARGDARPGRAARARAGERQRARRAARLAARGRGRLRAAARRTRRGAASRAPAPALRPRRRRAAARGDDRRAPRRRARARGDAALDAAGARRAGARGGRRRTRPRASCARFERGALEPRRARRRRRAGRRGRAGARTTLEGP